MRAWFITASTLATALLTVVPVCDGAGVDGAVAAVRCGRGRRGAAVRVGLADRRAGRLGAADSAAAVGELAEAVRQATDDPTGHDAATERSAALAADRLAVCAAAP
ncbi:MAG TPA: hypothetical protein VMA72_19200 [Streptosporangiaceae bacterium]|nr:hypothetical protein [Streptosporangiaceae bacterium]